MRNLFERINTLFGNWYEGLFGAGEALNPREVVRRLLLVAEEQAIEGLDGALYAPNRYRIEITLQDPERQEAYLAFLHPQELAEAVWRELQQEGYRLRGGVVCEIEVRSATAGEVVRQPLRIVAKFDSSIPLPVETVVPPADREEDVTNVATNVTAVSTDVATDSAPRALLKREDGTVLIQWSGRAVVIGRSKQAGCDVVIDSDRRVSRRHARVEWDAVGGHYLVYDLQSTNGVYVNGKRVDNRILASGDRIRLGETVLLFEMHPTPSEVPHSRREIEQEPSRSRAWLLLYPDTPLQRAFPLPNTVLIGRALTADVVVEEKGVAMRHAVLRWQDNRWHIEDLGSEAGTILNGQPLPPRQTVPLRSGDTLRIGEATLRFEVEEPE